MTKLIQIAAALLVAAGILIPALAQAHCDTMDGPVIQAARVALEKKDVTPVLRWVSPDGEAEVKSAFAKTLVVRTKGEQARELADQYFFETLVRIHRAGEGEPFTGIKPAGTESSPAIVEADKALETGSVDPVVKLVTDHAASRIRRHFADVQETKQHADDSVKAGREFVAAYVKYVHFVESLDDVARGAGAHHQAAAGAEATEHKPDR